ncbi:hypothetical protein HJB56_04995 [Rhizobium lentis]|uniref:hypothetical protein n=1 Tax=Rhizobium lentis TaxID=1138194 RepID=UPI001C83508C|nr:hypothetical protein [Rhizobium lentis]MBX5082143.1 hypothetical protein [Rhizobium lentis]MBX5094853.1 hypothetical protein [Rhizobium lentis]MBX5119578.1 hypothetical protein [Rhizobium lentis]
MTNEPAVGSEGRALLRRIRLCCNQYAAQQEDDRRAALDLGARGFLQRHGPNRSLLALTAKGEAFLDKLMRCE